MDVQKYFHYQVRPKSYDGVFVRMVLIVQKWSKV
jgi:hypothetical protein